MGWPLVQPKDFGIRPAGLIDACFFCKQQVGAEHRHDCIVLDKKVRVSVLIQMDLRVPYVYGPANLEYLYNEGMYPVDAVRHLFRDLPDNLGAKDLLEVEVRYISEEPNQEPIQQPEHNKLLRTNGC